jgi:hypothetical protein
VSIWDFIQQSVDENADKPPLSIHDLHDVLSTMWAEIPETPPTITIWVDGVYEDGEPDNDDSPLVVGDYVQLSYARISLLAKGLNGRRPWVLGKVEGTEPWDESLEGKVFVQLSNGRGAWWERDKFLKVEAA